jgi:hypothetical protein
MDVVDASTTSQVSPATGAPTTFSSQKKELTPEQRAVELKKHVARRGESKLRAAKAKADATKVKVAELM